MKSQLTRKNHTLLRIDELIAGLQMLHRSQIFKDL
jgi:hypothetical protein